MSEQWYYLVDDGPKGPFDRAGLADLAKNRTIDKSSLVSGEPTGPWRPAGELHPDIFAVGQWHYAGPDGKVGPLGTSELLALVRSGGIRADTLVWRRGMAEWLPAGQVLVSFFKRVEPGGATLPRAREVLGNIGATISDVADVPTIGDVPVRDVLVGGLRQATAFRDLETEDELAVGTRQTTPPLAEVSTTWPRLKIFWRTLASALAVCGLLSYGLDHFGNTNFFPGLIAVGSFMVPFSVVIAFLEMNVPRNVSLYQVAKMLILGGALSLVVTSFIISSLPGAGSGALVAALLTGIGEETSKALILLLVLSSDRYPYQLNGLLFGSAVGAGFAGFESAGYSFTFGWRAAYQVLFSQGGYGRTFSEETFYPVIYAFMQTASSVIWTRGVLAPASHVIWTAMIGSALWKAKRHRSFEPQMALDGIVLRRWAIACVLHGLWDAHLPGVPELIKFAVLGLVGWYLIIAILKQALDEVEKAKPSTVVGPTTP